VLARLGAFSTVLLLLHLFPPATSWSNDKVAVEVDQLPGGGSTVTIGAEHGSSSGGGTATDDPGTRDGTKRTCTFDGSPIDCTSPIGTWSNERQCWVSVLDPQPPLGDPRWEGHTDGTLYACRPPGAGDTGTAGGGTGGGAYTFWAAPGAGAPVLVDPVELAERAVDRMALRAPRIGATPLDPDAALLVGMHAWFWLEDAGPRSHGPIERTVTAGPVSVTARATVTKVVWQTGDGTTVVCRGAGTPWAPQRGTGPSPTCGHRYDLPSADEPDGAYRVRATTHWRVEWDGAGQSGVLTFTMSGSRALRVSELQVLQAR
jgi:hypothetical protein